MIEILETNFSVDKVIESVRRKEAGAVIVFIGTVRADPGLKSLELESYKEMALDKLKETRSQAMNRYSILDASIVHRTGNLSIGENIVVIAVSSKHRTEAFNACRFLIDELKATAPIWKKEIGPGTWKEGESPRAASEERVSGMIDVSDKKVIRRKATAEGYIDLSRTSMDAIRSRNVKKGDVLEIAKIAAVNGVKHTPTIIPLCHPVPITGVDMNFEVLDHGIKVTCTVKADYKTGVEMEALAGVNSALLTIWDMIKYLEKDEEGQYPSTRIHGIKVLEKRKG
jgi:cyclic pyranopterin phosphate synthase